jgi:hypothetical protein
MLRAGFGDALAREKPEESLIGTSLAKNCLGPYVKVLEAKVRRQSKAITKLCSQKGNIAKNKKNLGCNSFGFRLF